MVAVRPRYFPRIAHELLLSAFIGLLFALFARRQFRAGVPIWGRETMAVLSFVALVEWPIMIYLHAAHPDWAWMYTHPSAARSILLVVLVLLAALALVMTGYVAGWALVRARRDELHLAALGALGAGAFLLALLARGRVLVEGDYDAFHSGHARPLHATKLGWTLAISIAGAAIGVALVADRLRAQGRATVPVASIDPSDEEPARSPSP